MRAIIGRLISRKFVLVALLFVLVYLFIFSVLSLMSLFPKTKANEFLVEASVGQEGTQTVLEDSISIPKLNVTVPLLVVHSTDPADFKEPLQNGVAIYPSVLPGEKGGAIVLGHSAPPGWPKKNYDWVFSRLYELKPGDQIIVNFDQKTYTYEVKGSSILQAKEDIPPEELPSIRSAILLVSCWPPGIDNKRIVVRGEVI